MDLFQLMQHISENDNAIQFLRDRGILRSIPPRCRAIGCQREMTQIQRRRRSRGDKVMYMWRCPSHKGRVQSIRMGSFLVQSHLEEREFVLFAYLWAIGAPHHIQEKMCGITTKTVIDWNSFLRDICSRQLLENPIRLGGPGHIVQIDESLMSKRKYHVGREIPERWVFGMYDVDAHVGVLQFVPDRTQATLFNLITQYVIPGTTIHSDRAAMYVNNRYDPPVSHIVNIPVNPPYLHESVNHTNNFVDPRTGSHTNHVENFWKNAKMKNKAMSGTTQDMLPAYLDEFQWRQLFGKKEVEAFNNILRQISHFYPVND